MTNTICEINVEDTTKPIDPIKKNLQKTGAVKVKKLLNDKHALTLAKSLGNIVHNSNANEYGIVKLMPLKCVPPQKNHTGFTKSSLYPHTDRSPLEKPPNLIFLWCKIPENKNGGIPVLVDCKSLAKDFSKNDPKSFNNLMIPGTTTFNDGIKSYKGAIFEKSIEKYITVRFRHDSCVFFNGEILDSVLCFMKYIEKHSIFLKLSHDEGYIIQNNRWLHGRTSFNTNRLVCRIHINSDYQKCHIPPGFLSPI